MNPEEEIMFGVIFSPNGSYCVLYLSNKQITWMVSFNWGIFSHVSGLDHLRASENFQYIISLHTRPIRLELIA